MRHDRGLWVGGWMLGLVTFAVVEGPIAAQDPPVHRTEGQHQEPQGKPNRLAKEASPYLRQHQHNPVEWYPWGEEALARAKKEDKPIFLSIGYSACHWCHVMAAESFADPDIAKLMNEHFVCIKVDREERPDIDEIYMASLQAMGQQGGWPLSAWLCPDGTPFFGGTYFPPEDGNGRPGFRRVLQRLHGAWTEDKAAIVKNAAAMQQHLQRVLAPTMPPGEPVAELLAPVLPAARASYDEVHAGFAPGPQFAPKFPSPMLLQALLRLPGDEAMPMVQATLRAMANGGLHDQLAGGFHRYSTDRRWHVPHFEKMLCDNALLASCYLEASLRTGDGDLAAIGKKTLDWMLREMRDPLGGFWSSTDAQSEGVEGKFFVWQLAEFEAVLGTEAALLAQHFGVTKDGNWEHTNVLAVAKDATALAKELGLEVLAVQARLQAGVDKLLAARGKRVRPGTDDKVLTAWNGMALEALATGYRVLGDERYRAAAQQNADFLVRMMAKDGRTQRAWHSGMARHRGCLEDQGALAQGLLALFAIDSDPRWLAAAQALLRATVQHFGAEDGGFWFTADDHEALVARTKIAYDGSTPSGTALAVAALQRAGLLLGDAKLQAAAVAALRSNHALFAQVPAAVPALVRTLQFHTDTPREVVVAGEPGDPRTQALLEAAWRAFPDRFVVVHVHDGNRAALTRLAPWFADKKPLDGVPCAYVCRQGTCRAPVTTADALRSEL